jgi:hypothetical protein
MGRATLTIVLAALLAPLAGYTGARLLAGRGAIPAPHAAVTPTAAPAVSASHAVAAVLARAAATAAVPPPPLFVGDTWRIAAAAIDDTAAMPMNRALIGLARRYLGRPYAAFSLDRNGPERLVLDLQRFDCFLFVEQLLALVNSRRVSTQTDGVNRFADQVRQLRYGEGKVDYCLRHHYFSRWAEAAERKGYVVNITRFLPGATARQRPLTYMSSHPGSYEPMRVPRHRECITALEKNLVVNQAYIPVARLPEVLPSLRSGDIFALVTKVNGLDVTHVGLVEVNGKAVDAIHAAEGRGVMRSPDLARYAAGVKDGIGLMVLRPMPRPETVR